MTDKPQNSTTQPESPKQRKPDWLKVRLPGGERYAEIRKRLRRLKLHTVCEEAHCPNMGECWQGGTATFMILGDTCTRGCRFCAVNSGKPTPPDPSEPEHLAEAVTEMELDYVVLTSVDRDDLADGGAAHYAQTIKAIKLRNPGVLVELLIPDFAGDKRALQTVLDAEPDVLAHNIEVVQRLTRELRDARCDYDVSLGVLSGSKELAPHIYTKSSIMVGVGEIEDEVRRSMRDLITHDVDFLCIGQYLRPTMKHHPVIDYIPPEVFKRYEEYGKEIGFKYVAAGPLVRTSYRAGEFFIKSLMKQDW